MEIPDIKPEIWGAGAWTFMHYVALTYPTNPTEDDRNKYHTFFHNLQFVLPCSKCAKNYSENLSSLPLQGSLENNQQLFKWTVDMHNLVNKESNKKQITHEEAMGIYLNQSNTEYDLYIKIGFALLIIILLFYLNKRNIFSF